MADKHFTLTADLLHQLFEYRDGVLYRKTKAKNQQPGSVAGCRRPDGYIMTRVNNRLLYVHRIIYWMHYGITDEAIDHIDMNPSNNRIENLRACKRRENAYNRSKTKVNTTGVKNVYWSALNQCFKVQVTANKIRHNGGSYNNIFDAAIAARKLRESLHKQFAKHD